MTPTRVSRSPEKAEALRRLHARQRGRADAAVRALVAGLHFPAARASMLRSIIAAAADALGPAIGHVSTASLLCAMASRIQPPLPATARAKAEALFTAPDPKEAE
jgi:hypothetical protein